MNTVNVHEAKTHLSRYLADIESGRELEIVIARNGKPVGKLVSVDTHVRRPIRIGLAKGKYRLPDDFDRDNELIAAMMEGRIEA